jgi:dolichol-phosphate mannosyltransferase
MSRISIVVPVYHNARSLPRLLDAFRALAARHPDDAFQFVFVDDGSGDDSYPVLLELARGEPRVKVVKLSRNFGSNPAILAGLEQATGDAVVAIAADLQDPPELIDDMLALWRQGRKVVLAARRQRDDPWPGALVADAFYALFRRFAVATMPKRGFDFFLVDRQVCDLINGMDEKNVYLMGLILWLGFEPATIHYDRRGREERYGRSMWSLAKKVKYFIDAFVAFSYLPVRAAALLGVVLSAGGVLYAAVVVLTRFLFAYEAPGWASIMVVLLVVSGAQLLTLGILGEYVWRSLDEARPRPRFIVENIVEGSETVTAGDGSTSEEPG